jgi:hypothetical protein
MRRGLALGLIAAVTAFVAVGANQSAAAPDLVSLLARVGAAVERYYARAQSLICVETVRIQSLGFDLIPDQSAARQLTYELRVAWEDAENGQTPEAVVQRELLKIGNRAPRAKDKPQCLDPSAISPDTLEMLLPAKQSRYAFALAGATKFKGRTAVLIDYKSRHNGPVSASAHEDREDCWKIDMPGHSKGRIWIDAETDDVLRLDEHLNGFVDVMLPADRKRTRLPRSVVFERLDTSVVFGPIAFADPNETLTLPISVDSLTVVRNAGTPRVRKTQRFSNYRRFITGGRIVNNH